MATDQVRIGKLPLEGRAPSRWRWAPIVLGFAALIGVGAEVTARHDRAERARRDAYWRVDGPPCAPLDPTIFRSLRRYPQATPYDEILYRRAGGTMTCTHLVDRIGGEKVRYPICKFNAPDYLAVSLGGRDRFYDLTAARSAAVTVIGNEIRCVVIPPFRM
ncbi:hypothetical protein [Caulobacter segnis]|jgi:hypothetical protein|uniref:hypothetical protein n=1 Tax=Caulobacter segnis TaxID=88688 RepID=UPI001CBB2325|nr:hypothetical protein [Caulobacter segnis]UAL11431.1 hypothetical protein K8940_03810 [Caulobacter segnis]